MNVVVALLAVVVALIVLLVAGLLRSHAELLRRLEALEGGGAAGDSRPGPEPATGRSAPDLAGTDPDGAPVALSLSGARHDTLLLFLSRGCVTCRPFWEVTAAPRLPRGTRLVVVTADDEEPLTGSAVTVVRSTGAWRDYGVPGSPYVVLVRGGRVVGEGTGTSWDQVLALLAHASRDIAVLGHEEARSSTGRDTDAALLAAGILPGDPRLYPPPEDA